MKSLNYIAAIMNITIIFLHQGAESVRKLGATSGTCSGIEPNEELCPKEGVYKYVRIKTYNGKYWHATPSEDCWGVGGSLALCVKTRCCGPKPSNDQQDILEPGRRTTFRVHCQTVKIRSMDKTFPDTLILETLNTRNNNPSGYYLCNVRERSYVFTKHIPRGIHDLPNIHKCRWILHQWRGSVIGLEPMYVWKWTTFDDDEYGQIRHGHQYTSWFTTKNTGTFVGDRPTPHFADTYTLEVVPQECLDVQDSQKIQAGPDGATSGKCEENPDKCFMNNGWNFGNSHPAGVPKCFYRKDSMCFQPNRGSRQLCVDEEARENAKTCELAQANCCYDHKNKECYQAKSF